MTNKLISTDIIAQAYSYDAYLQLTDDLLAQNKTTGTNHSEAMVKYTQKNRDYIVQVTNNCPLTDATQMALSSIQQKWIWLVLAEAWCGDVAANLPIIHKMANCTPNIELKIILRDENLEIMDAHLTNGGRGIPKLVCLNADDLAVLGSWGPRPAPAQQMIIDYKKNPVEPYMVFFKKVFNWYAEDKGQTIQNEFLQLIKAWQK